MPHEHLSLHLLHGLQSDAYHDDDGGAADGQRVIADQVAGDDGGDSHHGDLLCMLFTMITDITLLFAPARYSSR